MTKISKNSWPKGYFSLLKKDSKVSTNQRERWLVFLVLSGMILLGILIPQLDLHELVQLSIVVFVCVGIVGLIFLYDRGWHLSDARVLFLISFVLYGIGQPIFGFSKGGLDDVFSLEAKGLSGLAFFLGGVGLVAGLYRSRNMMITVLENGVNDRLIAPMRIVAFFGLVIGLILLEVYYRKAGGLFNSLQLTRRDRAIALSQPGWTPWFQVCFSSVVMYCFIVVHNRKRTFSFFIDCILLISVVGFLFTLWFLEGERGRIGYIILALIAIVATKFPIKVTLKSGVIFLVIWTLFCFMQQFRQVFPKIARTGDWSHFSQRVDITVERGLSNFSVPIEFRAPYVTLLHAFENARPISYGSTYFQTVSYMLPRSLYRALGIDPSEKQGSVSKDFGEVLREDYGFDRAVSWGYLPVAEAYRNFGWLGPTVVLFMYALVLNLLVSVRERRQPFLLIIYATIMPLAWRANRTGFSNCCSEIFWQLATTVSLCMVVFFLKDLRECLRSKAKRSELSPNPEGDS